MAPRASVIIPAFNLARYLPAAIDSALAQDDPGGEVEVIVIDDGSTDDTSEVLAGYSDRVRAIRQRNAGLVGAVDRGLSEARGEYLALLDADDEWPRDRLARHVALLEARPELGLVHGDMRVVDATGATLHPSFFAYQGKELTDGRVLGRLIEGNFVSGGASTFRASLLPALHPIAPDAAYPDWWIAACVACVAEIAHEPGIANIYRFHGENMGLGSDAAGQLRKSLLELPWRRWMLRHLAADDTVTAAHLRDAIRGLRYAMLAGTAASEVASVRSLLSVDRVAAASLVAEGDARSLVRALAYDPLDAGIEIDAEVALIREAGVPAPSPAPALITLDSRARLVLGWLDELVAEPSLLHAFAKDAAGEQTLAVLAPRGSALGPLIELVEADPLCSGDGCDIIVINEPVTPPAGAYLAARADSRLSRLVSGDVFDGLERHGAIERALAQQAR
jgi:hypothetical protein